MRGEWTWLSPTLNPEGPVFETIVLDGSGSPLDFSSSGMYFLSTWLIGQVEEESPLSKIPEVYHRQAEILKALAHPTRLYITGLLAKGPLCVCEITEKVGDDISTVSKHLSVMRSAGILSSEKRGLQVIYTLETPCVTRVFLCADTVISSKTKKTLAAARS